MTRLCDLAKILRSKNSGPFELTIDIFLPDEASYRRVLGEKISALPYVNSTSTYVAMEAVKETG